MGTNVDLVSLMLAFETHMSSFIVPKEQWPAYLPPVVSSEATEAYSPYESMVSSNFDTLEEASLTTST